MGRVSQRKGRTWELELARLLRGYGYDVQPGQAVSYGATPDLVGLSNSQVIHTRGWRITTPSGIQCKHTKEPPQADGQGRQGQE